MMFRVRCGCLEMRLELLMGAGAVGCKYSSLLVLRRIETLFRPHASSVSKVHTTIWQNLVTVQIILQY